MIKEIIYSAYTLLEYPELLKTKKEIKEFCKDLLKIKRKLNFSPTTILDIGAARGVWSEAAREIFPLAQIYAFEPIKESFIQLEKRMNKDSKFDAFNFGLSDLNGKIAFSLNDAVDSSSILKMTETHKIEFPQTRNETNIEIETYRLDSIKSINLEEPIYIKMDVQGAELLVLKGAGRILDKVHAVQLEVNFEEFYEKQAMFNSIFEFMYSQNFKRFFQIELIESEKSKNIIASDIVFLR